uniref:Major facilitator superfamily (MFS) profile domain-containing protein n=1 Tax=Megaselia scalaris TaxID=36166 RepID=T1H0Q0_MEGSC
MTNAESTNDQFHEFQWSSGEKQLIISSFYWGYALTQLPGGYLALKFGSRLTALISVLGSAILSMITPVCVMAGEWQAFMAIRIVQGLFQGMIFPSMYGHLSKWAPKNERTLHGALANSGIECGTVFAMGVSGLIAASSIGWPGISYVSGGFGLVWAVLCDEERKYIQSTQLEDDQNLRKLPTPWLSIFTSLPFLALLFVRCTQAWGFSTMMSETPIYMNEVLKFDIKKNALFSALPYMAMWIMSYIYVFLSELIIKKEMMSLSMMRKTFSSIASIIPALAFIGLGFVDDQNAAIAVSLIVVNVGGERTKWQIVFAISAAIFLIGNTFYCFFGKTDVQPWNAPAESTDAEKNESKEKKVEKH